MNRRSFIKKTLLRLSGIGLLTGFYTWQIEPFWVEFVKVKMPVKNLPENLAGKTLMQISDLHVGDRFNFNFLLDAFREAKAFNPYFVVYTGDYVTSYQDSVQPDLEKVMSQAVTGKLGTFAILGNHDYGKNWSESAVADKISATLSYNGIQVLRNDSAEVEGLAFIGFEDFWSTHFQAEKAMSHYDPSKATISLCHNPDVCDLDVWGNYDGWILSGHTHGGQVKPPFLPPPMLPVRNKLYTSGLFHLNNGRTLYINRALGHLWQVRFNVRPEITVFELEVG